MKTLVATADPDEPVREELLTRMSEAMRAGCEGLVELAEAYAATFDPKV